MNKVSVSHNYIQTIFCLSGLLHVSLLFASHSCTAYASGTSNYERVTALHINMKQQENSCAKAGNGTVNINKTCYHPLEAPT
jgi:hypothetical protein